MPSLKGVYLFLIVVLIGVIFVGGCTQSSSPIPSSVPGVTQTGTTQVKVDYSGKWLGSIGAGGISMPISGTGSMTFDIKTQGPFIIVAARKMDNSTGRLSVAILKNGTVIKSEFTDAPQGIATTSGLV